MPVQRGSVCLTASPFSGGLDFQMANMLARFRYQDFEDSINDAGCAWLGDLFQRNKFVSFNLWNVEEKDSHVDGDCWDYNWNWEVELREDVSYFT